MGTSQVESDPLDRGGGVRVTWQTNGVFFLWFCDKAEILRQSDLNTTGQLFDKSGEATTTAPLCGESGGPHLRTECEQSVTFWQTRGASVGVVGLRDETVTTGRSRIAVSFPRKLAESWVGFPQRAPPEPSSGNGRECAPTWAMPTHRATYLCRWMSLVISRLCSRRNYKCPVSNHQLNCWTDKTHAVAAR